MLYHLTNKSPIFRCLLMLLAVAMLSATASAYDFSSGVLCYNINSDGKSVSVVSHLSASGAVTIPATVKNGSKTYSVTDIGKSAFSKCTGLTKITFPTSLTSIEAFAFSECTGLTEVTIPATLKSLGHHSFYGCTGMAKVVWNAPNFGPVDNNAVSPCHFLNCTNIKSFVFGNNVTSIPNFLCDGLTGLTTVTIPATVTKIGIYAFERCYNLTTVNWNAVNCQDTPNGFSPFGDGKKIKTITFASNIKRIPSQLCRHMTALTSVTIPATVTEIGEYAFEDTGLTSVTIPAAVTTVGNFAFRNCANLTKVIWNATNCKDNESFGGRFNGCPKLTTLQFGTTVTRIPAALCRYTENLKSVTLPNSLTEIGEEAFKNCEALTEVTAGTGLKTVKDNAFDECTALTKVNITNLAAWCGIDFSTAKSNPLYYAKKLYLNGTLVTSLTIPNVTVVKNYTFYNCTSITELTVPKTVTSFSGSSMFTGCTGLKKVVWNSPYYKEYSFYSFRPLSGLDGIQTISFAGSVTKICPYMCYGLKGLTTLTIPESVTMVGKNAFANCTALTTVNWNAANCADFTSSDTPFTGSTSISTFNFGNTVKSIPDYLCYNLTGLKTVTIGTGVTKIGYYCFNKCTGLTRVNISDIAKWCGIDFGVNAGNPLGNPLYHAKNLYLNNVLVTDLTIPATVTEIKKFAFSNATCLKSVTIPASVTTIGIDAFSGCTGLTRVNISDIAKWCGIEFVSYISNPLRFATDLYLNGAKVTDLIIPNTVTSINKYAFNYCENLTSVTIPPSVKTINSNAFNACTGLTRVNISDLEAWCGIDFASSTSNPLLNARHLYLNGEEVTDLEIPPTVESVKYSAFSGCSMASLTIPATVRTIGTNAFNFCDNLTEIVAKGEPAQIKSTTFSNAHYSGAKLHVREQYAEAYHAATYWKQFTNLIADVVEKPDPAFPDLNHDGAVNVCDVNLVLDDILTTGGTTLTLDVNDDGAVNVGDVNAILDRILALSNQ